MQRYEVRYKREGHLMYREERKGGGTQSDWRRCIDINVWVPVLQGNGIKCRTVTD